MVKRKKSNQKFAKKLLHKYRLVILNEDTFEERLSFRLTKLNVFVAVSLGAIILIAGTTVLIAFTGLREYIPGYSSSYLKKQATELAYKTDSLQNVLTINNRYYESIRKVLTGDLEPAILNRDSLIKAHQLDPTLFDLSASRADSLLRAEVTQEDKYNVLEPAGNEMEFALFPPVKGAISEKYNLKSRHYAVDVVVAQKAPVKAVADGRVIFSEWSAATGHVLIIEHNYGLLSVYKHNSSLTKEQGDFVRYGEVVALAGSSGELSTGPHLHFELWKDGNPVNPTDYIDFE